ncbi:unnamed protein product [Tetraodon nigroviridis]|uniref:(spotted green pufferfish) hypothetical protein n=1 Tax=Tetraodon nigroviridis TaxID=99883 RepID=Q4TBV2_TETNG|nr:unnamed protein product [Tetraodon nigroviridis]
MGRRSGVLQPRAVNVDLQTDATLQVDISDALSERDKVKFTVHTKSTLSNFKQNEFSVVRQHEEFIWLHDSFVENEEYAGYIIPPAPPRPDFDASREKLQKLGEGEGSMTKEEFTKMKQELEAEYLAIFKKTVAMHEVFLCRIAAHPVLRKDLNFHVFLEYNQDLSVRGKNKKEKLEDFFKNVVKSADGVLVAGVKDVDDFFEHEKTFLLEYHNRVKDASVKSDRMIRSHKNSADDINRIASSLYALGTQDSTDLCRFFLKVSELFEKTRKIEARVAADEDLKLADLLKYYLRESQAAKGPGLWWTTKTPTRLWTKLGPRTGTSCRRRPASSSAATSLRRSLSRLSKSSSTSRRDEWRHSGRTWWSWQSWSSNMQSGGSCCAGPSHQKMWDQPVKGQHSYVGGLRASAEMLVWFSSRTRPVLRTTDGRADTCSTEEPEAPMFRSTFDGPVAQWRILLTPDPKSEEFSYCVARPSQFAAKDGVVFGVEKLVLSKLYEEGSNKRIFNIDRQRRHGYVHLNEFRGRRSKEGSRAHTERRQRQSVGAGEKCVFEARFRAVAGLLADARSLADVAKEEASSFRSNYGYDIPLKHLADRVAMYVHAYTLYSAVRPFGCSFILGSFDKDDGPQLYMVDPSGISYGYWGCAIGKAKQAAKTEIEKLQMKDMTCRELVKEVAKIIYIVHDEVKDKAFELELSWVGEVTNGRHTLVPQDVREEAEKYAKDSLEEEDDSDEDNM